MGSFLVHPHCATSSCLLNNVHSWQHWLFILYFAKLSAACLHFRVMGASRVYCSKGTQCDNEAGNNATKIAAGFPTDRTTEFNFKHWRKISKNGKINKRSKKLITICSYQWYLVMGRSPFNKLKHDYSNIEQTWTCLAFGNQTSYFWFGTKKTDIKQSTTNH